MQKTNDSSYKLAHEIGQQNRDARECDKHDPCLSDSRSSLCSLLQSVVLRSDVSLAQAHEFPARIH